MGLKCYQKFSQGSAFLTCYMPLNSASALSRVFCITIVSQGDDVVLPFRMENGNMHRRKRLPQQQIVGKYT